MVIVASSIWSQSVCVRYRYASKWCTIPNNIFAVFYGTTFSVWRICLCLLVITSYKLFFVISFSNQLLRKHYPDFTHVSQTMWENIDRNVSISLSYMFKTEYNDITIPVYISPRWLIMFAHTYTQSVLLKRHSRPIISHWNT